MKVKTYFDLYKHEDRALALHEEVATIDDPRTSITKIDRSVTSPTVFYLFEGGNLAGTMNIENVLHEAVAQFPSQEAPQ
jgi:hypothetical protein